MGLLVLRGSLLQSRANSYIKTAIEAHRATLNGDAYVFLEARRQDDIPKYEQKLFRAQDSLQFCPATDLCRPLNLRICCHNAGSQPILEGIDRYLVLRCDRGGCKDRTNASHSLGRPGVEW